MAPTPTLSGTTSSLSQEEREKFEALKDVFNAHTASEPPVHPSLEHNLLSQTPQQLANFQSSESKIAGFFNNVKSKFAFKELFGSLFVFLYIGNQINNFRMGKANNEILPDGSIAPSPDMGRMINSSINAIISAWTFFSTRAAQVPEGNNPIQRAKYAMENLDKCQVQVRDILALSGGVTSMLEHFLKGFQVFQRLEKKKLAKSGADVSNMPIIHDNARIAQGVLAIVANGINVYALLGPEAANKSRKEQVKQSEDIHKVANFELRPFKEAASMPLKGRIKENVKLVGRFIKQNPMLILNSAVGLATAFALNIEGRMKDKAQDRLYGMVEDFADQTEVPPSKKNPQPVPASDQLFSSLFKRPDFNKKINAIAAENGIKPEEGTPANFLAAFRGNSKAMKELNELIPDGKKALGEAGRRAIQSSIMGIILNIWGLIFRAQQVMREDKVALGLAR